MRENQSARKFSNFLVLKSCLKNCFSKRFARNCAKISTELLKFSGRCAKIDIHENLYAQELVRIQAFLYKES